MVSKKTKRRLDLLNKRVSKGNKNPPGCIEKKCGNCKYYLTDKCLKRKLVDAARKAKKLGLNADEIDDDLIEDFAGRYNIGEERAKNYLENPPSENEVWKKMKPCPQYRYRGHYVPDSRGRRESAKQLLEGEQRYGGY